MDSPIWNRLYVRIDPTVPENIPPYCTQRRLVENGPVYYYHPCVPFDVMQSRCSNWISWGDVRIRHESGTVGREETISLLRIKSGLDLKHIQQSTSTDLCLVIEGKFPSNSSLNWNQWLSFGKEQEQQNRKGLPSSDSDDDKASRSRKTAIKAIEYFPSPKMIKKENKSCLDDLVPKINLTTINKEFPDSEIPIASNAAMMDVYIREHTDSSAVGVGVGDGVVFGDCVGVGVGFANKVTASAIGANNTGVTEEASTKQNQSSNINRVTEFVEPCSTSVVNSVELVDLPQQVSRLLTQMLQNTGNTHLPIENSSSSDQLTSSFFNKRVMVPRDRESERDSTREKGNLHLPSSEYTEEEDWNSIQHKCFVDENHLGRSKISSAKKEYSFHPTWNRSDQDHSLTSSRKIINYPENVDVEEELEFGQDFEFDDDWEVDNRERNLIERQDRRFFREPLGLVDDNCEYATFDRRASMAMPTAKKLKHDSAKRSSSTKQLQDRKLIVPNHRSVQTAPRPYFGPNSSRREQRYSSQTHSNFDRESAEESRYDKQASQFNKTKSKSKAMTMVNQPNRSASEDESESSNNSTRGVTLVNRLERQLLEPFSNAGEWNMKEVKQPTKNNFYLPSRQYHV